MNLLDSGTTRAADKSSFGNKFTLSLSLSPSLQIPKIYKKNQQESMTIEGDKMTMLMQTKYFIHQRKTRASENGCPLKVIRSSFMM
jgi:hypothetical protein